MSPEETAPHGLSEGIALVCRAQDSGAWKPVADWFARNPERAESLARFIGGDRQLGRAVSPPQAAARVGSRLGEYELIEVLGHGAMGVVYRAIDRLKRTVAVKVVEIAGLAPADLSRVRFEAEAMAGLNHPNVVPLYAYGETETELYFAMPLMSDSLAKWLKNLGPDRLLDPKTAAEIVRDVALGVHHAHQSGLIHRDLKPANILLDRDGAPHVADFGLARRADAATTIGCAGTPAYMAPEQARGDKRLTTAIDVHALGAVLYELLTGRAPFGGGDVPSVLRRVIEEPAPMVGVFRPDVPRDLQTICARCLKKDPNERYPSAQALAADLTKFLAGDPIDDSRGWVWNTVSRALSWQRPQLTMGTANLCFWGSASTVFAMAVVQAAILLGAPLWVSHAAIAYYFVAWLGLMWGFLVVRRDALNPVERASTALHFGAKFACLGILPVHLALHDGNPVYALPSFMAIVGMSVFAHGVTYWGRFYLTGVLFFVVAASMPLVPVTYWPAIYGGLLGVLQVLAGLHLRAVHQAAQAARRADPDPPGT